VSRDAPRDLVAWPGGSPSWEATGADRAGHSSCEAHASAGTTGHGVASCDAYQAWASPWREVSPAPRMLLLGTAVIVGAGLTTSVVADAAEVRPGGFPDIVLSGFARFRVHGGQLDDARLYPPVSRDPDFSTDTEVRVLVPARDEATGLEYGAVIEFEADTRRTDNTDESWLFVRGGFGEIRFGDEDGVADNSSVGGQVIAAGTGGIDGAVVDAIGTPVIRLSSTDDATKIRYYTPRFGGFRIGVSYTPQEAEPNSGVFNGGDIAGKDVQVQNIVDGGLTYSGSVAGVDVLASVVGITGDLQRSSYLGYDSWHGYQAGVALEFLNLKAAGSYASEKVGVADRAWYTAGAGFEHGPASFSVTFGKVTDSNEFWWGDKPWNLVFSASYFVLPGLVLAGDLGVFDNDLRSGLETGTGDRGWQAVGSLGLSF
jgi:outer membrane protein OmpU